MSVTTPFRSCCPTAINCEHMANCPVARVRGLGLGPRRTYFPHPPYLVPPAPSSIFHPDSIFHFAPATDELTTQTPIPDTIPVVAPIPDTTPSQVSHPSHYTSVVPGIECIDVSQWFNFNRGNAIKYIWRAGSKHDEIEDLQKAIQYLQFEIARLGKK